MTAGALQRVVPEMPEATRDKCVATMVQEYNSEFRDSDFTFEEFAAMMHERVHRIRTAEDEVDVTGIGGINSILAEGTDSQALARIEQYRKLFEVQPAPPEYHIIDLANIGLTLVLEYVLLP